MRSSFRTLAAGLLLIAYWMCSPVASAADLRSNIESWTSAFDVVSDDNVYVRRVQNIFDRLKSVVGNDVLLSELYILDSDNEPWAIALEDGNVVLSRGSLDIVYGAKDTSLEAKDAQIAFILGHELNHIAKEDFWHEQVYLGFVSKNIALDESQKEDRQSRRREFELRADEDGFLYASLAGFNTRTLFTGSAGTQDFLHYWVRQTRTGSSLTNFNAAQRVAFLADTMSSLDEAVKYFEYGTRLAHFGYFEEAESLFNEFYKIYPSTQVLNNLGFIYVQLARSSMPVELSERYWYPHILNLNSGLPDRPRSLSLAMPEESLRYLQKAKQFLQSAAMLDKKNSDTALNLATAHLYMKDYTNARAVLEVSLRHHPQDLQLQMLMAIAVLEDEQLSSDLKTSIRNQLLSHVKAENIPLDYLYNTALLIEASELPELAKPLWERIGRQREKLPSVHRKLMCYQSTLIDSCEIEAKVFTAQQQAWMPVNTTGIRVGASLDEPEVKARLKQWSQAYQSYLSGLDAVIFEHPNGDSLLAIDRVVTLVTLKQHQYDFKQHLVQVSIEDNAPPLIEKRLGPDTLLFNDTQWAARSTHEKIQEIWFSGSSFKPK
ncbi:MAG: tetratricopeptide repeat protein [Granulosicoccus sp.]|nr:tetratricopeptide repeat protein [Granulosicoccus sp.]